MTDGERDPGLPEAEVPEREVSRALVFVVVYYLMSVLSLGVHLWVAVHGWAADGMWWGLAYLGFFIYAELYWCYRALVEEGPSLFAFASGLSGLWWVVLLVFRKRLSTWLTGLGGEE